MSRSTTQRAEAPLPRRHRTPPPRFVAMNGMILWSGWAIAGLDRIPTLVEWATFALDSFAVIDALFSSVFS